MFPIADAGQKVKCFLQHVGNLKLSPMGESHLTSAIIDQMKASYNTEEDWISWRSLPSESMTSTYEIYHGDRQGQTYYSFIDALVEKVKPSPPRGIQETY